MRSLDDHGVGEPTRLLDTVDAEETVALLERFKEELGQGAHAVDGPEETVEALQKANVHTLLVHDDPADGRTAWFGADPTHLALDEATVRAMGAEHPHPGRLIDVCLRAAYGTSAEVRVVPSAVVTDALAALLRW
jgi:hypothetical protein